MVTKIIETKRLYLRQLLTDDKNELSRVLSDSESMLYYPHPFSEEEVSNWIQWNMENYKRYNHGLWAVILKDSDKFIGDCGITMQTIEGETVPEIGFHIVKEYWNQGYATEAAFACKEYAFNVLGYTKIFSYTSLRNISSQRVAEKIGMKTYTFFEKNGEQQIVQFTQDDRKR